MLIYLIIILAISTRFIPHMPNFAPITALAIFSATQLGWKKSLGLTFAVRFISDIFLGFFAWPLMLAVYVSHLAGVLFGLWVRKSQNSIPSASEESLDGSNSKSKGIPLPIGRDRDGMQRWTKIIFSSLSASVLFFLVTNFAFLYAEYPHNFSGIMLAYTNGLPFLRGTVVGDLGYIAALFGVFELAMYFKNKTSENKILTSILCKKA